MFLLYATKTNI